ncbi:MAG: HEAT repeat domain-containing protein [Acidobacteria bacterium]|nr:HEAT repeat domain-containing protein [Acidobacteriota bacterium]
MTRMQSLIALTELLHRALKAQSHYAQEHPQARHSLEEAHATLRGLLQEESPLVLQCGQGRILFQGQALDASPVAVQALARDLEARGFGGLVFHQGIDADELQLLFFALQLKPQRLSEMGGPKSLLPDDGHLRVLDTESPVLASQGPDPNGSETPDALPHMEGPLPAVVLADELRRRFSALIQKTAAPPKRTFHMPWTSEHREVMKKHGLKVPDFGAMAGTGVDLNLGKLDPVGLREVLRTAFSLLSPLEQGAVLLGMATFPADEQALRRALDYLGPELLAQVTAHVHVSSRPSRFELALLVASLLQCVKDRDLSLEAIRGRLQFEGWSLHEVDQLREAILWECQGTDTKMQQGLADRGLFELDPQQVMILIRQIVRGKRYPALQDLLGQLEVGIASPQPERRRQASEILADLAECIDEPGLPSDLETKMHRMIHGHLASEIEAQALVWSCQGMESLLGHWIRSGRFDGVYREIVALNELALARDAPAPRLQGLQDLLARMASPLNMATLAPLLHEDGALLSLPQLHALLTLLGRPAAAYLAVCLEIEEDPGRAVQVMTALRAIGRAAIPSVRDLLGSEKPGIVAQALVLLGEIGPAGSLEDVILSLGHPDVGVKRSAVRTLAHLGGPQAAGALATFFLSAEPSLQMDCLDAFVTLRDPAPVHVLGDFLRTSRSGDLEVAKVRLRVVETLGLLGSPEGIPALAEMFKKKGFLGGRESEGMRLASAKALAGIATREAREAMAMALDSEKEEEVRAVLRQFLVAGGGT